MVQILITFSAASVAFLMCLANVKPENSYLTYEDMVVFFFPTVQADAVSALNPI